MVEAGIKPIYVFDGKPHPLKLKTLQKRGEIRSEAEKEWKEAIEKGDMEEAFKKAVRTSRINEDIIMEAKKLLAALGIPYIDAPGEGEAQAAHMARKGDVDGVASQDFDCLLFGAPRLIRNLAVTGKRKLPDRHIWVDVHVEEIILEDVLKKNGITREQLVDAAILIGTDFNDGVKGIGPKKAIAMVKKYGNLEKIFENEGIEIENYEEVRNIFLNPNVRNDYEIKFTPVNEEEALNLLCNEHQFNEERVKKALEKYKKFANSFKQASLFDF